MKKSESPLNKINQIEQAIRRLSPADFGKLCVAFLHARIETVVDYGNAKGTGKTRAGMPDAYIRADDGSYTFIQFTTAAKAKLPKKLEKDIDDCFAPSDDLPDPAERKIEKIILCFTEAINPKTQESLYAHLASLSGADIELELLGIDLLAHDILRDNRYAPLAKHMLGIELDSGQLLTRDKFVRKFEPSVDGIKLPLSYPLVAREAELEKSLQLLEESDVLLLHGQAGVGKTRLALAVGEAYLKAHPKVEFRVIEYLGGDALVQDLQLYLREDQPYLILVDDINRLLPPQGQAVALEAVLQLLRSDRPAPVKLIVTVREHAKSEVISTLGTAPYQILKLTQAAPEEIRSFVKDNFSLNEAAQDHILRLSQGNFRLAVMASKKAQDTNSFHSIHDAAELFEAFFRDVRLTPLSWQLMGIISFFQCMDWRDRAAWKRILAALEVEASWGQVQSTLDQLYQQELIDQLRGQVKVEDQVFASYAIYRSFIKDQRLDFYGYLKHLFAKEDPKLVRDALIPLFNYFGYQKAKAVLQPAVAHYWKDIEDLPEAALRFWRDFWHMMPDTCLGYLYRQIQPLPVQEEALPSLDFEELKTKSNPYQPGGDETLNVLLDFCRRPDEHFDFALQLIFLYLERRPRAMLPVSLFFRNELDYELDDLLRFDYLRQRKFVGFFGDTLDRERLSPQQAWVLLSVVPVWLKTDFRDHASIDRNTIHLRNGKLPVTASLQTLRKQLWEALFQAFSILPEHTLAALRQYPHAEVDPQKALLAQDLARLLPFIEENLDPMNINHTMWVHGLLGKVDYYELDKEEDGVGHAWFSVDKLNSVNQHFSTEVVEVYHVLRVGIEDRKQWSREDRKTHDPIKQRIERYFKTHDFEGFRRFLDIYENLYEYHGRHWATPDDVSYVFEHLLEQKPALGLRVVALALARGNKVQLGSYHFIRAVLDAAKDFEQAFEVLDQASAPNQVSLLLALLYEAPQDERITPKLEAFLALLRETPQRYLWVQLEKLSKVEAIRPGFLAAVLAILMEKKRSEQAFTFTIDWKDLIAHASMLEKLPQDQVHPAYLETLIPQHRSSFEWSVDIHRSAFKYLLGQDTTLLAQLIEVCQARFGVEAGSLFRHESFGFVWEMAQAEEIIRLALNAFKSYFHVAFEHPAICLFKGAVQNQRAEDFLHHTLRTEGKNHAFIKLLFEIITYTYSEEQRLAFLQTWLQANPDDSAELLRELPLTRNGVMVNDHEGAFYDHQISFLERIKSLSLLKRITYLPHRETLAQEIQSLRHRKRSHQERDFFEGISAPQRNGHKPFFKPLITPDLLSLYDWLLQKWPLGEFAVWTTRWLADWMLHQPAQHWTVIEVDAEMIESVYAYLSQRKPYQGSIHLTTERATVVSDPIAQAGGYLIHPYEEGAFARHLWQEVRGVNVPRLEKILVDLLAEPAVFPTYQGKELARLIQSAAEETHLYLDMLQEYATQRGVSEKIKPFLFTSMLPYP